MRGVHVAIRVWTLAFLQTGLSYGDPCYCHSRGEQRWQRTAGGKVVFCQCRLSANVVLRFVARVRLVLILPPPTPCLSTSPRAKVASCGIVRSGPWQCLVEGLDVGREQKARRGLYLRFTGS
jgi:hypothetical protein